MVERRDGGGVVVVVMAWRGLSVKGACDEAGHLLRNNDFLTNRCSRSAMAFEQERDKLEVRGAPCHTTHILYNPAAHAALETSLSSVEAAWRSEQSAE